MVKTYPSIDPHSTPSRIIKVYRCHILFDVFCDVITSHHRHLLYCLAGTGLVASLPGHVFSKLDR